MKLIVQHQHQNASPSFLHAVRQHLKELGRTLRIDEARFVVARSREASPPFRVAAHLVTPGPDLYAEAVDHTPGAALTKAIGQLATRIRHRLSKRAQRAQKNPLRRNATTGARF